MIVTAGIASGRSICGAPKTTSEEMTTTGTARPSRRARAGVLAQVRRERDAANRRLDGHHAVLALVLRHGHDLALEPRERGLRVVRDRPPGPKERPVETLANERVEVLAVERGVEVLELEGAREHDRLEHAAEKLAVLRDPDAHLNVAAHGERRVADVDAPRDRKH